MDRRLKGTIDIIKFFIEEKQIADKSDKADFAIDRKGDDYLLGQIIRQVWLPKENYYVSTKAMEKWEELGQEPAMIFDTFYKNKVVNVSGKVVAVDRFTGAAKTSWNTKDEYKDKYAVLNPNEFFNYREVFHDDHITTIQSIKDKLFNLTEVDDESIINILKTIKIAKIMKGEDRDISRLKKGLEEKLNDEIIKKYYQVKNILLLRFDECANNK